MRDTGVGIAPEDQEAVFEEFRQSGTAVREIEGTGLGLALALVRRASWRENLGRKPGWSGVDLYVHDSEAGLTSLNENRLQSRVVPISCVNSRRAAMTSKKSGKGKPGGEAGVEGPRADEDERRAGWVEGDGVPRPRAEELLKAL